MVYIALPTLPTNFQNETCLETCCINLCFTTEGIILPHSTMQQIFLMYVNLCSIVPYT